MKEIIRTGIDRDGVTRMRMKDHQRRRKVYRMLMK
jgi:hypothetical protein